MIQRMPRPLDGHEIRVLGCLLEKQLATPEYYPLTQNAVVAACNQRSNRYPVLSLSEREVNAALQRLHEIRLVARDDSGRALRWRQTLDRRLSLETDTKAALTVLLLRGPQTAGEVRARTKRLHEFDTTGEAEAALAELAGPPDPLVELLEREPGQKEPRWAHRAGQDETAASASGAAGSAASDGAERPATPAAPSSPPAADFDPERVMLRLARLEQQLEELRAIVERKAGLFD